MKIIPLLQKLEKKYISIPSKSIFLKQIKKGDFVSVVYYELEKEQIRLQQFTGVCTKLKSKGLNTKISIRNILGQTTVEQQFFLYSKSLLDVAILRKN